MLPTKIINQINIIIQKLLAKPQLNSQLQEYLNNYNIDEFGENFSQNIKQFEISENEWLIACIKQPFCLFVKPNTLKKNVETNAKEFGITQKEWINLALKAPKLFILPPNFLQEQIKINAKKFNVPQSKWIALCLQQPNLFYHETEKLQQKTKIINGITQIIDDLRYKKKTHRRTLCKIENYSMTELASNFSQNMEQFGYSENEWLQLCEEQPAFLYISPSKLKESVDANCEQFKLAEKEWIGVLKRQYGIATIEPNVLAERLETNRKLFNTSTEEWKQICLQQPTLFYARTETLKSKIDVIVEHFDLPKDEAIQLCLASPQVLSVSKNLLTNRMKENAALFNVSTLEWLELCQKYRPLCYLDPKKTQRKYALIMRMYMTDMIQIDGEKEKNPESLKEMLFNNPAYFTMSIENIRKHMTYARYLKAQKRKRSINLLRVKKYTVESIIAQASPQFMATESQSLWFGIKRRPVNTPAQQKMARIMANRNRTKE